MNQTATGTNHTAAPASANPYISRSESGPIGEKGSLDKVVVVKSEHTSDRSDPTLAESSSRDEMPASGASDSPDHLRPGSGHMQYHPHHASQKGAIHSGHGTPVPMPHTPYAQSHTIEIDPSITGHGYSAPITPVSATGGGNGAGGGGGPAYGASTPVSTSASASASASGNPATATYYGSSHPHPHAQHPPPLEDARASPSTAGPGGHGQGPGSASASADGRPTSENFTPDGNPIVPVGISGGKMFQCRGYGACDKVFTRSEHLARHVRYVLAVLRFIRHGRSLETDSRETRVY